MVANVISWSSPTVDVYRILPPPKEDFASVIAIMFTGAEPPTLEDFKRTPLLVNSRKVLNALNWLKLNHADYADIEISHEHLAQYDPGEPPVPVFLCEKTDLGLTVNPAVFDDGEEDGTEQGDCPFIVHGICGEDLQAMSIEKMKGEALKHFNRGGKVLGVGRSRFPQSIFRNEQLYPQLFPWLFPYGLGGVGSIEGVSDTQHKKQLLMYHDKRFQTDPSFPFVAFSHEQIKTATTRSFLIARRTDFNDISDRFLRLDRNTLSDIVDRLRKDEHVVPATAEEKDCYEVIQHLDAVTGAMHGSTTSKKWMRNEIWSLVYHCGSPLWFITLSPADNMHPLSLYYAGREIEFKDAILPSDERLKRIANNPVAAARFFDYMVKVFIEVVLGFDESHNGLYGPIEAFYGSVEQQGRLTLHLHSILWNTGSLSPNEMRELVMEKSGSFQQAMIQWLESNLYGGFIQSTFEEVSEKVATEERDSVYQNPVLTMPVAPPPLCVKESNDCIKCQRMKSWWGYFRETVNDLLFRSNLHNCERMTNKDGSTSKKKMYKGCRDNKFKKCKARFPRKLREASQVDPDTGAIFLKQTYEWINTVTPILTYICRCNTDVTSLLSGTAVKAVLVYVSDYITKSALKTYAMFECIRTVIENNAVLIKEKSLAAVHRGRVLMTKISNQLSAQMELGAPMICLYLLGHPDKYTSHVFVPFYWRTYVYQVRADWDMNDSDSNADKIAVMERDGKLEIVSSTLDYICRPVELESMCLYDFVMYCRRDKGKLLNDDFISQKIDAGEDEETLRDGVKQTRSRGKLKGRKNPKSICYSFQAGHPLIETHYLRFLTTHNSNVAKNRLVVNFLGGVPPRRDGDDPEFYSCTMLTFFKPWRNGRSLKTKDETWEDSFLAYSFADRYIKVMKNFNLRYECLDSRDDFRSQMRAGETVDCGPWMSRLNQDVEEVNDTDVDEWQASRMPFDIEESTNYFAVPSKKELLNRVTAAAMCDLLESNGWGTPVPSNVQAPRVSIPSSGVLSSNEWAELVKTEKEAAINSRTEKLSFSSRVVDNRYSFVYEGVRVLDYSYLQKDYLPIQGRAAQNDIAILFSLNTEQERAFRIVSNHAQSDSLPQLNLYIGGMGGTGKSQVLKALVAFFSSRLEKHRIMIVAPTGNAASLLNGTTYHYAFGLNMPDTLKTLGVIQERLRGVDYIFFDEISMCSAHDLYRISSKLCRISGKRDTVFGGFNMIFAGDFAQLPPAIGGEAVSLYSPSLLQNKSSKYTQEQAIGQVAWHMVTSVVILRQNMRQKSQTPDDARFRKALENMRYKACTPEDIQFLRSLIANQDDVRDSLSSNRFRDVAIITGLHTNKDIINAMGVERFAAEQKMELFEFFSEDTLVTEDDGAGRSQGARDSKARHPQVKLSRSVQRLLWEQPPGSNSKKIAGKLRLCYGMPIILKYNFATELCMVNGQRGTVVGWDETIGTFGQRVLDVLFIHLTNPAKDVNIPNLPVNVVPIVKTTNKIQASTPSGHSFMIKRQQVEIAYDFAMTDYASQGYTRINNAVNLADLRTHQGYYTALSRSSSASGTIIIQGFDHTKIVGRCSRALRREFRELELLDEISKRRYEGSLPFGVVGPTRREMIHQFFELYPKQDILEHLHPTLRWSSKDPLYVADKEEMTQRWNIVHHQAQHGSDDNYVVAKGSSSTVSFLEGLNDRPVRDLKRKRRPDDEGEGPSLRISGSNGHYLVGNPLGVKWDSNSCAYDAVSTVPVVK
ncbi:ATP-dependent DNA helicase [Pleurotus pulmonarius]